MIGKIFEYLLLCFKLYIKSNIMNKLILTFFTLAFFAMSCQPSAEKSADETVQGEIPGKIEAKVFFVAPNDGDTITSPVKILMGVEGMTVEPAGKVNEGKGHHHIIVDGSPSPLGAVVPADSTHFHYGGGQTEAELNLLPGSHTLTMQFADGVHASYGESLSETITVFVVEADTSNLE